MSYMTLAHAQGVARTSFHLIRVSCAVVVLILFDSPLCTLHRLSRLPFHSPDSHLHLHLPCGLFRVEQIPFALPRRDDRSLHPGVLQRQQALKLA